MAAPQFDPDELLQGLPLYAGCVWGGICGLQERRAWLPEEAFQLVAEFFAFQAETGMELEWKNLASAAAFLTRVDEPSLYRRLLTRFSFLELRWMLHSGQYSYHGERPPGSSSRGT
ncbi:hypothetical protein WJX72_011805 [[Myrmecia] bisecta]|uniref:Uncharacterized protein n=1 Tax=[Myrmecia] bisecta TaxID=41462 RepID=A0AAW1R9L4_9CHLO